MSEPRYEIRIFYTDEAFVANIPELPYCSAWGESYEDALKEVLVAVDLYLDTLREDGREVPEPKSHATAS